MFYYYYSFNKLMFFNLFCEYFITIISFIFSLVVVFDIEMLFIILVVHIYSFLTQDYFLKKIMVFLFQNSLYKNKNLFAQLLKTPGIGKNLMLNIFKKLGFSKNLKKEILSKAQISKLIQLINKINLIGNKLIKLQSTNLKKKLHIKLLKATRMLNGLPTRGQRTHTNRKTALFLNSKRFYYFFNGKAFNFNDLLHCRLELAFIADTLFIPTRQTGKHLVDEYKIKKNVHLGREGNHGVVIIAVPTKKRKYVNDLFRFWRFAKIYYEYYFDLQRKKKLIGLILVGTKHHVDRLEKVCKLLEKPLDMTENQLTFLYVQYKKYLETQTFNSLVFLHDSLSDSYNNKQSTPICETNLDNNRLILPYHFFGFLCSGSLQINDINNNLFKLALKNFKIALNDHKIKKMGEIKNSNLLESKYLHVQVLNDSSDRHVGGIWLPKNLNFAAKFSNAQIYDTWFSKQNFYTLRCLAKNCDTYYNNFTSLPGLLNEQTLLAQNEFLLPFGVTPDPIKSFYNKANKSSYFHHDFSVWIRVVDCLVQKVDSGGTLIGKFFSCLNGNSTLTLSLYFKLGDLAKTLLTYKGKSLLLFSFFATIKVANLLSSSLTAEGLLKRKPGFLYRMLKTMVTAMVPDEKKINSLNLQNFVLVFCLQHPEQKTSITFVEVKNLKQTLLELVGILTASPVLIDYIGLVEKSNLHQNINTLKVAPNIKQIFLKPKVNFSSDFWSNTFHFESLSDYDATIKFLVFKAKMFFNFELSYYRCVLVELFPFFQILKNLELAEADFKPLPIKFLKTAMKNFGSFAKISQKQIFAYVLLECGAGNHYFLVKTSMKHLTGNKKKILNAKKTRLQQQVAMDGTIKLKAVFNFQANTKANFDTFSQALRVKFLEANLISNITKLPSFNAAGQGFAIVPIGFNNVLEFVASAAETSNLINNYCLLPETELTKINEKLMAFQKKA